MNDQKKCYANRHLTMEEQGLWEVGRSLQHGEGQLHFNGPDIAKKFYGTDKNAVYRVLKRLIAKNWIEVIAKPTRDQATGQWTHWIVRFLSHDEFQEAYPQICEQLSTVTEKGNGGEQLPGSGTVKPFPKTGMAVPEFGKDSDGIAIDGASHPRAANAPGIDFDSDRVPRSGSDGDAHQTQPQTPHSTDAAGSPPAVDRFRGQRRRAGNVLAKRELIEMAEAAQAARPDWPKGKVYFEPKRWKDVVNRLIEEYGRDEVIRMTAEATSSCGSTFAPRGYATWLLAEKNGEPCRLEKMLEQGQEQRATSIDPESPYGLLKAGKINHEEYEEMVRKAMEADMRARGVAPAREATKAGGTG